MVLNWPNHACFSRAAMCFSRNYSNDMVWISTKIYLFLLKCYQIQSGSRCHWESALNKYEKAE